MPRGSAVLLQRSAPGFTLDNSASGSKVKPCLGCRRAARDTKACLANGLKLVRIRFRVTDSELPELKVSELSRYLLFLLGQGKSRPPCPFPRAQTQRGNDGLCRLQRLCRRDRWALAHSLNSLKRNLPAGCKRHSSTSAGSFQERQCTASPPLSSPDYLAFCRREVRRMFPLGWDGDYERFVYSHVPRSSARLPERSRADHLWMGRSTEFLVGALTGGGLDDRPLRARYKEVLSAGKVRPLVVFDERVDLLAPLHKMMYRHLSTMDWLLKGPPTEEKIESVCAGYSWFTSVDLVSATDNLPLDATEAILGALLAKCSRVPGRLRLLASNSLRPIITKGLPCADVEVTHGQMMGGYLSFPLLCIQSYLAARWAVRGKKAKILVNGDDTLIATGAPVLSSDYPSGFILNDTKTIRAENVAELNSTVFLRSKGRWREVRHLRRGAALSDYHGMLHLAAACRRDVAWTDALIRSRIGQRWGFLPSQLELHPASYPAFQRQWGMGRVHTSLPDLSPDVPDIGLIRKPGQPAEDEMIALRSHLWREGRPRGEKAPEPPSHGKLRRTYRYRTRWRQRGSFGQPSYLCSVGRASIAARGERKDSYSVPAEYEPIKEKKGLISPLLDGDGLLCIPLPA